MPATFDLRYETSTGRCAWCWEALPEKDSHTAVSPLRPPYFDGRPLRFHHECWPVYQALAELDARPKSTGFEVTPESLEKLRIHAGLDPAEMSRRLHIGRERYLAIVKGNVSGLSAAVTRYARTLAGETGYGRMSSIDWTQPTAVFCFRMHLGKTVREMASIIGFTDESVTTWEHSGVRASSLKVRVRLDRLAARHGFDASMVLEDRAWTPEFLLQAVKQSQQTNTQWAITMGSAQNQITGWITGRKAISRVTAWKLTRAALRFQVALPEPTTRYVDGDR